MKAYYCIVPKYGKGFINQHGQVDEDFKYALIFSDKEDAENLIRVDYLCDCVVKKFFIVFDEEVA